MAAPGPSGYFPFDQCLLGAEQVLPGGESRDRLLGVQIVRRANVEDVRLLLGEQSGVARAQCRGRRQVRPQTATTSPPSVAATREWTRAM